VHQEEVMTNNIVGFWALNRLNLEQRLDQALGLLRNIILEFYIYRPGIVEIFDLPIYLVLGVGLERRIAC